MTFITAQCAILRADNLCELDSVLEAAQAEYNNYIFHLRLRLNSTARHEAQGKLNCPKFLLLFFCHFGFSFCKICQYNTLKKRHLFISYTVISLINFTHKSAYPTKRKEKLSLI